MSWSLPTTLCRLVISMGIKCHLERFQMEVSWDLPPLDPKA